MWLTPLRAALANCAGLAAAWRALRRFPVHLATGRPIAWDKTQRAFPSLSELRSRRGRLADVLRFWDHVGPEDLQAAVQTPSDRHRPIGRLLVDRGVVSDEDLAAAYAERGEALASSFDPFQIAPEALKLLTARDAARFGAAPLGWTHGALDLALAEPLDKAERAELEKRLGAAGVKSVRVLYAPLSDVVFAVRYAWTPGALAKERATVDRMVEHGLLAPEGAAQLWRSIRAGYCSLADALIRGGAADHRTLQSALRDYWRTGAAGRPDQYLVRLGLVSEAQVAAAARRQTPEPIDVARRAVELNLIRMDALRPAAA